MFLAALALIPALALAAPPPSTAGVFVVSTDKATEGTTMRFGSFLEDALAPYGTYTVRRSEQLFGLPEDAEARAALKKAEAELTQGVSLFDGRKYEDAERVLKSAVRDFSRAAPLLKDCSKLCDATAYYAAALQKRGDSEEAKLVLMDLLALGPTYELNTRKLPRELVSLRATVAGSNQAALRGTLEVKSKPEGARVFVDGEALGYSPAQASTLRPGKHFVRVERPGYQVAGQLVDVSPEPQEVALELKPTAAYRAFQANLEKVARETKAPDNKALAATASGLGLTHVLLGTLRQTGNGNGLDVTLAFYDGRTGHKLAERHSTFQEDEFGQLKAEVQRAVNQLLNGNAAAANPTSKDPLQKRQGTENWSSEDHGGKQQNSENQKPPGDPLKHKTGTEDW